MKKSLTVSFVFIALIAATVSAQSEFNYNAQKSFIPKDLGRVYLGIPLKDFAVVVPVGAAEVDSRFAYLQLIIPMSKGNMESLTVRIHGITQEQKQELLFEESTTMKDDLGNDYENTVEKIDVSRIPNEAFVYSIVIEFKKTYDLKSYVIKTYGKDGEVRKADDEYHFFDIQWTKETSDGLTWLIRSFHEGDSRSLQLHGRIEETEWGLD